MASGELIRQGTDKSLSKQLWASSDHPDTSFKKGSQ